MAKKSYLGINNKAKKNKKIYIGIESFVKRDLPSGYTQVAWIKGTGSQYVDTGFIPNQDTRVVFDFEATTNSTSNVACFGSRQAASKSTFALWVTNQKANPQYGSVAYNTKTLTLDYVKRLTYDFNKNVFSVDSQTATFATETFSAGSSLCLLAVNDAGTVDSRMSSGKIYSCQIYDNGTLVRDYVPCINSSGKAGLYDMVNKAFNAGVGTFVTGSSVNSVARRITKGYIGIGGVARPFFSGGELVYYGTIEKMQVTRAYLAATTVGNYALFGGGYVNGKNDTVDAYDKSLTHTVPTSLNTSRYQLSATTVGDYALFGGGRASSASAVVEYYNKSLTRATATSLSKARYSLATTTIGNYALFGGGCGSESAHYGAVDAYDNSLTRTTPTALNYPRRNLAATTVGDYALFGGGDTGSTYYNPVDAYNASLTRTDATRFGTPRNQLAATTVGDYALFGGGFNGSVVSNVVDAYDTSLTRTTTSLHEARCKLAATTVGNYAIFGGGFPHFTTVDVFDTSLTRTTSISISTGRESLAATSIGNYALFGGGWDDDNGDYLSTVDAFVAA